MCSITPLKCTSKISWYGTVIGLSKDIFSSISSNQVCDLLSHKIYFLPSELNSCIFSSSKMQTLEMSLLAISYVIWTVTSFWLTKRLLRKDNILLSFTWYFKDKWSYHWKTNRKVNFSCYIQVITLVTTKSYLTTLLVKHIPPFQKLMSMHTACVVNSFSRWCKPFPMHSPSSFLVLSNEG